MITSKKGIEEQMHEAIAEADHHAQELIQKARDAIKAACDASLVTSALVAKSRSHHRSNLFGWMLPIMKPGRVKDLLYLDKVKASRNLPHDKISLQRIGVIDQATAAKRMTRPKATRSMVRSVAKATASIQESFDKRPPSTMSADERLQYKTTIEPLGRLYIQLSTS